MYRLLYQVQSACGRGRLVCSGGDIWHGSLLTLVVLVRWLVKGVGVVYGSDGCVRLWLGDVQILVE